MHRRFITGIVVCMSLGLGAALTLNAEPRPAVFPDIEMVTRKWSAIPMQVFPVNVTVMRDLETPSGVKLPKGEPMIITGQDGFRLNAVTPDEPSKRVRVMLEDTDLIAHVTVLYREWTDRKENSYGNAFAAQAFGKYLEERRTRKQPGEPLRNPDGSYPILLESMRTGGVTEITPDVILKWGEAVERFEREVRYWVVRVDYKLKYGFGKLESSAEAWIRDGRVEKWLYVDSGEVVP